MSGNCFSLKAFSVIDAGAKGFNQPEDYGYFFAFPCAAVGSSSHDALAPGIDLPEHCILANLHVGPQMSQ